MLNRLIRNIIFGIGSSFSIFTYISSQYRKVTGMSGPYPVITFTAKLTQRLHALPGEQAKEGVSSAGIGLRIADSRNYQLRADLARVIDGGGNKRSGDLTTHVQLVLLF